MSLTKNKNVFIDFTKEPQTNQIAQTTYAVPTAVDDQVDFCWIGGDKYIEWIQTGDNDAIFMVPQATAPFGWLLPVASGQNGEGIEMTMGMGASASMGSVAFTVGTDAAFFTRARFNVTTLANSDVMAVGLRKLGAYTDIANPAALTSVYNDKAVLGVNDEATTIIVKSTYSVGDADTDTTATGSPVVTDQPIEFMVVVSAVGVVSYYVALDAETTPLSRSSTPDVLLNATPLTITTGIVLVPYIVLVSTAGGQADVVLQEWEVGYW